MIQRLQQTWKQVGRWIRRRRVGRFAHSSAITLLTRPLWQHDRIRAFMGAPLVAAAVFGATTSVPAADTLQAWDVSSPVSSIPGFTIQTDYTYLLPVTDLTGISQYFHSGHPGIDFRAPIGSDVVSVDAGRVTLIVESSSGYGRHVYVEHDKGYTSLYAHLGLIMVEIGEEIVAGEKVGEIGMTGWTTGPHLHFELTKDGSRVNPIPLLSKALVAYK